MVAEWASLGTRVLTYISPFFSDPTNFTASASLRHNFYQEGINNDYFVQKETTDYTTSSPSSSPTSSPTSSSSLLFSESLYSNSSEFNTELVPYTLHSLSIEFCMLDTTNPAAVTWIKNIIKDQLIAEAQSSGWMCDFGEYLPFDAVLNNVSVAVLCFAKLLLLIY